MHKPCIGKKRALKRLLFIQKNAIERGLSLVLLKQYNYICTYNQALKGPNKRVIGVIATIFVLLVLSGCWVNYILTTRCLLPANYLVWEASRPLADCAYCENVTKAITLWNVTRREFANYAYLSKPIIVKNAIRQWQATKDFSFELFKRLYQQTDGSYESLEEGCQFLNFKTDLFSLREVFEMPEARARNEEGQEPWYVGWGNCHPDILAKVRQYYSVPEFLPKDAEFPATENIFFGYEIGAVMHLDYIPRLMWQGQVKGSKIWSIGPVPECDHVCDKLQFQVDPGDVGEFARGLLHKDFLTSPELKHCFHTNICDYLVKFYVIPLLVILCFFSVLLDTRVWYHATKIPKGQFSLTVQSEYG